jgi:hypothetical protein
MSQKSVRALNIDSEPDSLGRKCLHEDFEAIHQAHATRDTRVTAKDEV